MDIAVTKHHHRDCIHISASWQIANMNTNHISMRIHNMDVLPDMIHMQILSTVSI